MCVCVVDSLLAHVCVGKSTCVREQERKRDREREKKRKRERKRERQRAREFLGMWTAFMGVHFYVCGRETSASVNLRKLFKNDIFNR